MLRALFFCTCTAPLLADTVFLYNGTAIDGVIKTRHETSIELQIGNVGRIYVDLEAIESIEKNDRDGSAQANTLSLERKREDVEAVAKLRRAGSAKEAGRTDKAKGGSAAKKVEGRALTKGDVEPELRKKIEDAVRELTRQKSAHRVRAERELGEIGEQSLPFIVDVVEHENPLVRIAVLRIFRKVGNDFVLPYAIDRLEDSSRLVREQAIETLKELTGRTFNYRANANEAQRAKAVEAWRSWCENQIAGTGDEEETPGAEGDASAGEAGETGEGGDAAAATDKKPAAGREKPRPRTGAQKPAAKAALPKAPAATESSKAEEPATTGAPAGAEEPSPVESTEDAEAAEDSEDAEDAEDAESSEELEALPVGTPAPAAVTPAAATAQPAEGASSAGRLLPQPSAEERKSAGGSKPWLKVTEERPAKPSR